MYQKKIIIDFAYYEQCTVIHQHLKADGHCSGFCYNGIKLMLLKSWSTALLQNMVTAFWNQRSGQNHKGPIGCRMHNINLLNVNRSYRHTHDCSAIQGLRHIEKPIIEANLASPPSHKPPLFTQVHMQIRACDRTKPFAAPIQIYSLPFHCSIYLKSRKPCSYRYTISSVMILWTYIYIIFKSQEQEIFFIQNN